MSMRPFYRVSAAALLIMLAASAWGLIQVGPDATVPVHWNVNGDPDGYASALAAFAITPLIGLAVVGLLAIVPRIEPRRMNLQRSADAYRTVAIALVLLVVVIHLAVVLAAVGTPVPMGLLVGASVGVLFVIIGNVLGTVRSNFMFGVRTPWTLSSDRAWDRTHRLVGRLFVAAGLLLIPLAVTGQMALVVVVMLVFVVAILVTAVAYSYRVWRDDPDRRPLGGAE